MKKNDFEEDNFEEDTEIPDFIELEEENKEDNDYWLDI